MRLALLVAHFAFSASAFAQDYAPPDKELWEMTKKALADLPMSMTTHQQVQTILQNVEREAQMRAVRKKIETPDGPLR